MADLRFGGSAWCNLDIALRNLDRLYETAFEELGVLPIEAYVLRALFEHDGQRPSDLAHIVGRAATSFTPLIDGIERKGFTERRPHDRDRRSVAIYLTQTGQELKKPVMSVFREVERNLTEQLPEKVLAGFYSTLLALQRLPPAPSQIQGSWKLEAADPTNQTVQVLNLNIKD
jgi:DNA-binding MarR family transcriptional regulator